MVHPLDQREKNTRVWDDQLAHASQTDSLPEFDSYPGPTITPPSRMSVHPISLLTPEARADPTFTELCYLLEQARNQLQRIHAIAKKQVSRQIEDFDTLPLAMELGSRSAALEVIAFEAANHLEHIQHAPISAGTEGGEPNDR